MLQTISKHIQGWIAWVVIVIIAAAFVLWGLEYYITSGRNKQTVVATVNGEKITDQQLNNAYDSIQRSYTQQGAVLDPQTQHQLQNLALQQLILDRVLLQTANDMGFTISNNEIQQEILRIPAFQEKGQFSPQRFQQLLSNNGITPDQFLMSIKGSLLAGQLSLGLRSSSFVTSREVSQVYSMLHQQRNFGYFILPSTSFITAVQPTEEQIKIYYQQHTDQFRTPDQVKAAYILLSPDSIKAQVKVTPDEIQQYYQDNASEFSGKPLADVKTNIEQRLTNQKLNQVLTAKSEQLEDLAYTNPGSLNDAAKTAGLPLQTSEWMSRQGLKGDPLFSDPKVLSVLFSDEVLKQNNNSQLIELKDGRYLVLRVAQNQASQNQPLEAVRDQIKQILQKELGQKQAGLQAYEIQHALETGEASDQLAKRFHLTWAEKTNVTLEDKTLPQQLLISVFNLTPSSDPAKKAVTSILLPNGDYAIIQLQSLHNADFSQAPAAEQEKLRSSLANREGELDYQLFAKSAVDKAKVKNLLK